MIVNSRRPWPAAGAFARLLLLLALIPFITAVASAQASDTLARSLASQARASAQQAQRQIARTNRNDGWTLVSSSSNNYGHTGKAVATAGVFDTYRVAHVNRLPEPVIEISLGYGHYGVASGTEAGNLNGIQVKAAMELGGTVADQGQYRTPVTFRAQRLASIAPRALVWSDPVSCYWVPGATIYERVAVTVDANGGSYFRGSYLRGGNVNGGDNTGEGIVNGTDAVDTGNIFSTIGNAYSAVVIRARTLSGRVYQSVHINGDSISAGEDHALRGIHGAGHPVIAFENYPLTWGALGGETLQQTLQMQNFLARWEVAKYATVIFDGHGRNDLAQGRTVAQLKADILADAFRWMGQGKRYVKSTILPEPSSTDGWLTVANQGKSPFDPQRVAINQWLRDTGSTGFRAQARAQVAGYPDAGDVMIVNTSKFLEVNAAGVLADDGGYVLPATTTFDSGTASQAGTALLTDGTKAWAVNAYRGRSVSIVAGAGAGQARGILWNSATTITPTVAFNPPLDATSQYRITDAIGFTGGPHPHSRGHILAAQAYDVQAIMTPATPTSAIDIRDLPPIPANDNSAERAAA